MNPWSQRVILSDQRFDKRPTMSQFLAVLDALYPLFRKCLFQLDAETAHHLSLKALMAAATTPTATAAMSECC